MRAVPRLYRVQRRQSAWIAPIWGQTVRKIACTAKRQHVEPKVMIIGDRLFRPVAVGFFEAAAPKRDGRMLERVVTQDRPPDLQIRLRHCLRPVTASRICISS